MKAKFRFNNPDELEATMEITMNVSEWKRLKKQLQTGYPGWRLSSAISCLVENATNVFDGEHEVNP